MAKKRQISDSSELTYSDSIGKNFNYYDAKNKSAIDKTNSTIDLYNKKKNNESLTKEEQVELDNVFGEAFQEQELLKEIEQQEIAKAEEAKYAPSDKVESELANMTDEVSYKSFKDIQGKYDELSKKTYGYIQNELFQRGQKQNMKSDKDDNWLESTGKGIGNAVFTALDFIGSHVGAAGSQFYDKNKFTAKEEQEYELLGKEISKVRNPILEGQKAILEKKKNELVEKEKTAKGDMFGLGQMSFAMNDKKSTNMSIIAYEDAIELYQDAIDNGGFMKGLDNDLAGTLTLNIAGMEERSRLTDLNDKIKNKEELTEYEKDFLQANEALEEAKYSGLNKNMSYQLGEGIKETGKFIGEMAIVNRLTAGLGGGAVAMAETGKLGQVGVKAAEIASKVPKYITAPTGEIIKAGLSPSSYFKGQDKYNESIQEITDADGNQIFVSDNVTKQYNINKLNNANKIADARINKLQSKEKLTKEEEKELNKLSLKKEMFSNSLNQLVNDKGELRFKEKSKLDSNIYGITENIKERFSERFVGQAVDKFIPALGSALNKTKLGKAYSGSVLNKIVNKIDDVSTKKLKGAREYLDKQLFESNRVGKLSKALVNHTGSAKMMHSLPAEMIEEIAVQLTPTYKEEYQKQFDELSNPDFYTMVAAQTLILGGFTGSIGGASHFYNMKTNSDYRNQYNNNQENKAQLRDVYNNIDNATTDEQLAQDIAMSTIGSVFQINDYNARIAELRNDKADHKDGLTKEERNKKADIMEKNSFYNLGIQSIQTGTNKDFKKSLDRLSRNETVSEETRKNATLGVAKLSELENISEKHQNKLNYSTILDLSIRENLNNETVLDLDNKIKEVEQKANIEIQKFNRNNNLTEYFNVSNLTMKLEAEEQEGEYNNYIAKLKEENIPEVNQYLDLVFNKEMLEKANYEVSKKLRFETNNSNQEVIRNRELDKLKKQLVSNVTTDNVEEVKTEVREKEIETPDIIQEINDKAIENSNQAPEVVKEKSKKVLTPATDEELDSVSFEDMFGTSTNKKAVPGSELDARQQPEPGTQAAKEAQIFEQGPLFAPASYDKSNNEQVQKVDNLKSKFSTILNKNPNVALEGIVARIFNDYGPVKLEKDFNLVTQAWNSVAKEKISEKQSKELYNDFFGTQDVDLSNFGNEIVTQESKPLTEEKAVEQSLVQEVTQPSLITGEPLRLYSGRKFADTGLKAGFLGLNYTDTEDGKETVTTTINESAIPFVDFRNFNIGDEIELMFNYDYLYNPENKVSQWFNVDSDPVKNSITVKQLLENLFPNKSYAELIETLKNNPQELLNNEEFLKVIPVGINNKGLVDNQSDVILGGLNDFYWFNVSNVALKENSEGEKLIGEQRERIENNRKLNLETRKQIVSNGSVKTKVTERRQGESNKLLLQTEAEKEQGFSDKFQSLKDSFKEGTMQEAQKSSAIGIIENKQVVASGKNGQRNLIKINGKEISTDSIVNWDSFNNEIADREGSKQNTNGKIVMVIQNGVDNLGKPTYVLHNVINNHKSNQSKFKVVNEIKYKLLNYSDLLSGNKTGSPTEVEKAKKIRDNIKNNFGVDISLRDALNTILDFYSEQSKSKDGKLKQEFRQDLNPKLAELKRANNLPDLGIFNSVNEFESAFLTNNIGTTTYNDILYNNIHTQFIYTGVENKGEKIWTNEVQPVIMFGNEHLTNDITENIVEQKQEKIIAEEKAILNGQIKFKEELLKDITDVESQEKLQEEIVELKNKEVSLGNSIINIESLSDLDNLSDEQKTQLKIDVKNQIDKLSDNLFFLTHLTSTSEALDSIIENGLITGVAIESTTNVSVNKQSLLESIEAIIDGKVRHRGSSNLAILGFSNDLIPFEGAKKADYTEAVSNFIAENHTESFGKNIPAQYNVASFSNGKLNIFSETTQEFNNSDLFQVVENIVFDGLSKLDITKKITKSDIYNQVNISFDNLVNDLKSKGLNKEANFILENKEEILGEGYYDNSIKEVIDAVFNLSEDVDVLDLTGENVKSNSKESFENNIADSLSLKVKILLSGITDTRLDNTNNFAGIQSTMSFNDALDALQQVMSEINNNTLESVKEAIDNKIKLNEKEFSFYNQLLDRLTEIEKIDNSVINEILYSLFQPKVKMSFVLYNRNQDGSYNMETYDANTKNPLFVKRAKWQENFKNSNLITKFEEGFYKINENEYNEINSLHNKIIENEEIADVRNYFEQVGVKLNEKLYEILSDRDNPSYNEMYNMVYSTTGIIKNINDNLKSAFESDKVLAFSNNVITDRNTQKQFNVLTFNNSRLNDLIHADNNVSFIPMNMMYIAGKMINVYEQPKRISNILKKLKYDENFKQQLRSSQISSDNFLLNLLDNDKKLNEYIDVVMVSLEALKERGTSTNDKMSMTALSSKDAFVTLFNMFSNSEGVYENEELKDRGIKLRKGMINFPTLSDSSQLPLFKTILIDVQKENVAGNVLSENITDVLINQLLIGDLKRIGAFISSNTSTNIKGHDAGALFIGSMSSLNSLAVDFTYKVNGQDINTKRTLIEVFRNNPKYHTEQGVQDFIEEFKDDITKEINRNVNYEVNQYISEDGLTGEFIDNEIFKNKKLEFIDKKYLEGKGAISGLDQAKLVAYDYVINNLIQQKEIQTTFAGDVANYFKDSMAKDLINGHSVTNTQDIIDFHYKGMDDQINELINNENYQLLFERFPQLKFSDKFITSDITHEEQYQELIPVIQMKTKKMFEDVQNNLSKRLKELISPGNQFPNSTGNKIYKQIMVQDVENSSEVLENLVQMYHSNLYSEVLNDIREFKQLDNIYENNRNEVQLKRHNTLYKSLTQKLPLIQGFFKTASTDAQEYTSWKDNVNQLLEQGRITTNEYSNLVTKLSLQEADLENNGVISEQNKLTKEETKLAIMQPTKPLYSGLHFENVNGYNLQRDVYIKSSSFAITPELAQMFPKFNSLRKVINKLENGSENTVVRISYDSANKVGAVKNALPISELYKDDVNLDLLNSSVVELDRQNFYIQQDKPFKSDKNAEKGVVDTVTRASQFEKILLGDGINEITENIFPNMFDDNLINDLNIKVEDGKINGPALKQLYNEIYKREQKLFKDNLFRKLGIKDYADLENGNINSMEKLVELLSTRLTNKQDKKGLELIYHVQGKNDTYSKKELIENGLVPFKAEFKIPIFMTPNSRKFESVLNSVINKNSINLKLPGFSSPVASQEGFDFKGYEGKNSLEALKKSGLITTKNFDPTKGLQATRNQDGSLKYAQVFIANKYKVFNNETGQYDYIDLKEFIDENEQIDSNKLPEELLSMFSFRIPTSSHQSGVIIEVAGFLPHTVGDLMIVPKDHTVQIGEDYDIDTRYVYNYNYVKTKEGVLKKLEQSDLENLDNNLEEVKENYENYKKELFQNYFKTNIDTNSPLNNSTLINNSYWYSNREKLLQITILQDSLDNYNEDKVLHSIFTDEYDFAPIASKEEMQNKINELKASLIPSNIVKSKARELKQEYYNISKDLKEAFRNENKGVKKAYYKYANSVKAKKDVELVLQNNLVSLYKTVFSSKDNQVQSLINKTLSTDFAESTAKEMDKKINSNNDNIYNIYSPITQSKIMALGADGKMGIGVHSNAVTMNSLLQQTNETIKFVRSYNEETGEPEFYNMIFGDLIFDGQLGKVSSKNFRISESGMESQNSSTDNQKLQIMGRRNENAETINVFAVLQATGLDNDGIKINGKEMSYASLFINQPILREYTKLVKKYKSSTNDKKGNPEKIAIKELTDKYNSKVNKDNWITDEKGKPIVGKFKVEVLEKLGKNLTSEKLYNDLLMSEADILSQLYVLKRFNELKEPAKEYNRLQKFVNIENGGLGISYFDTIEIMNEMIDIASGDVKITGSGKMIGDIKIIDSTVDIENFKQQGYIQIKTNTDGNIVMIKPNNHYAHKIVNSITDGYNLWSSLFPYESRFINEQIEDIVEISNAVNDNDKKELKYKAISELKDYIYSNSPVLFNNNVLGKSTELFFDDNETKNVSLASYLLELSNNKEFDYIFKSPFFKDLQFDINEGTYPSTIKYNNNDISKLNNINIYNSLNRLVDSNKKLLDKNGKEYTEADLMKDLLSYSLLSNQENGAIGFRQLLPVELFDKYNVTSNLRSKSDFKNPNIQNLLYNGLSKSVESLLGNKIDDTGIVGNINNVPLNDVYNLVGYINKHLNQVNKKTNEVYVKIIDDNGTVMFNNYSGNYQNSAFVRQFLQHNSEVVDNISFTINNLDEPGARLSEFQKLLSDNKTTLKDYDNRVMTSFIKEPYLYAVKYKNDKVVSKRKITKINDANDSEIVLKENPKFLSLKDKNGNTRLYELKQENYYEQITTLGTFGFNEYQSGKTIEKSLVQKNNVKKYINTQILLGETTSMINNIDLDNVVKNLFEDKKNPYRPLLDMILPLVDLSNVQVQIVPQLQGNAVYFNNVVSINQAFLNSLPTNKELNDTIIEEMLHSITVEAVNKYVTITGLDETGKLQYTFNEGITPPASLRTMINVYQKAIDVIKKEQGLDVLKNSIDGFKNKIKENTQNSLTINSASEMDAYRVSDIHEFIAGIFRKNSTFAKKMATTSYLESGLNILQKYAETLTRLLYNILPSKRLDSISANMVLNLYDFLVEEKNNRPIVNKESIFNNSENNKIMDSEKLINSELNEVDKNVQETNEKVTNTIKTKC